MDPAAYILLYDVCACYPDVLAQLLSKALLPLLMNRPMLQQLSKQLHVLHQTRRSNLQEENHSQEKDNVLGICICTSHVSLN